MYDLVNFVAAQDVAIRLAKEAGTLRVEERVGRFGDTFWAICDDCGTIEVALSEDEVNLRIAI